MAVVDEHSLKKKKRERARKEGKRDYMKMIYLFIFEQI